MKAQLTSLIALAMATAAGIASAQDLTDLQEVDAAIQQPQQPEFLPMTRSERLRRFLTGSFGPESLARAAAAAEIGQVRNDPREWGRDIPGYAARIGSTLAQHIVRNTLEYSASSVLHEDNRYLRSGQKGFWKRTGYALTSTFLARHDDGRRGPALSRMGSAVGSSFISRIWLPPSIATVGAAMSSFGITIGADIGVNMLHEFWPDLKRHFGRK